MKKLAKFIPIFFLTAFTPLMASAACTTTGGLGGVICKISDLFSAILPVLVAFGVVYFVWGMVQYFIADGEEAKKTGKDRIIYGIIGLAVIISIWGLVNIVVVTFGIGGGVAPKLDQVAGASSACTVPVTGALLQTYLGYVTCIINGSIIPLLFALAIVMFVWGTIKFFIIDADDEKKRTEGKQFMIWGIVALAVMLSIWGLVGILGDTFGIKNGSILPKVTPPSSTSL